MKKAAKKTTRRRKASGKGGALMGGPSATGAVVVGGPAHCLTSATPWLLSPRGGEVVWLLQNRCTNARKIKIKFAGVDPLMSSPKEKTVPGGQMDQIVCFVKETAADGVYKYSVHGGDKILDPELEVRGPLRRPEKRRPR
jgi:hypothetical protein